MAALQDLRTFIDRCTGRQSAMADAGTIDRYVERVRTEDPERTRQELRRVYMTYRNAQARRNEP